MSSIPFEEAYEFDSASDSGPAARIALRVGATLLAICWSPMLLAASAVTSVLRYARPDALPPAAPADPPMVFPYRRAA